MPILTNKNVTVILGELQKRILNSVGVLNAIRQGSVNFENWVQIEICSILNGYINNGNVIVIERLRNIDICICNENNSTKMAIEIKIIKSGHYEMSEIIDDINKLDNFDQLNMAMERSILCVVYKEPQAIEQCEHILERINGCINNSQIKAQAGFAIAGNNGEDIQVVSYLNRWGGTY